MVYPADKIQTRLNPLCYPSYDWIRKIQEQLHPSYDQRGIPYLYCTLPICIKLYKYVLETNGLYIKIYILNLILLQSKTLPCLNKASLNHWTYLNWIRHIYPPIFCQTNPQLSRKLGLQFFSKRSI